MHEVIEVCLSKFKYHADKIALLKSGIELNNELMLKTHVDIDLPLQLLPTYYGESISIGSCIEQSWG
jgi:hypothetical protein